MSGCQNTPMAYTRAFGFVLQDYSGCGTSAALFDWVKDAATLQGEAPFEFRWVRAPEPNIRALLGNEWRAYFNNE